jgi:hypothetical protein
VRTHLRCVKRDLADAATWGTTACPIGHSKVDATWAIGKKNELHTSRMIPCDGAGIDPFPGRRNAGA